MVHFVIGRTKTGKSSYCLEEFANIAGNSHHRQPAYFIVPEQYALVTERKLLHLDNMKGKSLLQDEVISFKRLTHRILSRLGGLGRTHLDDAGKIMLLTQIAYNHREELCYYKELHNQAWQLNRILSLFAEFEKYMVTAASLHTLLQHEHLQGTLREKLHDLELLYRYYIDSFGQIELTEGALFQLALEKAKIHHFFDQTSVWIDSFTGFTKLEQMFISLLMTQCKDVTITLTLDDEPIFDCIQTTYQQLIAMARKLHVPYDSISLSGRDVAYYQNDDLSFLEQNYTKFHNDTYEENPAHIQIVACRNVFEEIVHLAQSIEAKQKNGVPYGKIAVSTRNPQNYGPLIEAVFAQYKIPYFVDGKRNVQSNPLVLSILSLLRMFYRNFRQEDVLAFMKAGLYFDTLDAVDDIENEMLARKMQSLNRFKQSENPALVQFGDFFSRQISKLNESCNIEQMISVISDCVCTLKFPDKLEQQSQTLYASGWMERGDLYHKIWSQVQGFFAQIKLFLGDLPVSNYVDGCETLYRLLSISFASYESAFLPQNPDAVQITSIDRSRVSDVDTLYLIGTVEGAFPSAVDDNGILSDQDRSWITENAVELADDSITKISKERFLIYTTLFAPAKELCVSYPLQDFGGKACVPATAVVGQIQRLCPKIEIQKFKDDTHFNVCEPFVSLLDAGFAKNLLLPGDIPLISVSRLETYRDCPYKFFLAYGIRAEERQVANVEFSDIGDLMHKLVETGTALVLEGDAESGRVIEQIFDDAITSGKIVPEAIDSGRGRILVGRLKKFAVSTLEGIRQQIQAGAFIPAGYEVSFGMAGQESMPPLMIQIGDQVVPAVRIHGKIDRFDVCTEEDKTYIRVIDYKSSTQTIKTDDVYHGKRLQLVTYMKALIQQQNSREQLAALLGVSKDQSFIPAGILYFSLQDDFDKINSKGEYEQNSYCMDGFVLNDDAVLDRMIGDESAAVIAYTRKNDGSLRTKSNWISLDDYHTMSEAVDNAVRYSVREIAGGKIAPSPQKKHNGKSPCLSCAFSAVCGTMIKE